MAERIAALEFAVALLAEIVCILGLATRAEIADLMRNTATGTRSAAVAKKLSAISRLVDKLERATREGQVALHIGTPLPLRRA